MKCKALLVLIGFPLILISQISKPIGINLTSVNDYSTELVFTDAMKQGRIWTTYNSDNSGPWDTNIDIPLDINGYPLQIPYDNGIDPPQSVRVLMVWDIGNALPVGKFRLIVQGTGQVKLKFGANGVVNCPVDTLIEVTGSVDLEIIKSNVDDHISDIKFIYPNYITIYDNKTFTDEFLDFVKDFQVIRFMDWLRTNNSTVEKWEERAKYNYYTQAQDEGVAWEYIVELCNLLEKDMWINIPHQADDDYIMQLAGFLKSHVNPDLKIYIEYSNEVWNSIFSQNDYCAQKAYDLGYSGPAWERAWKYTIKRSSDIFSIFESVFTNDERLVKIIPSQAANSWLSNQLLTYFNDPLYNPNQISTDALAIAPYFAGGVANQIISEGLENTITVEEIVNRMENSLDESYGYIENSKEVADKYNLELIVYEGGQHLVGTSGNENNTILTQKLNQANHHPGLQDVYCQYIDYWYNRAGGLFCHFSSHGSYSKWGSWGVKETMEDFENPKYLALKNCVFNDNILSIKDDNSLQNSILVFPNPTSNGEVTISGDFSEEPIMIIDPSGRRVPFEISSFHKDQIKIKLFQKGVFIIKINDLAIKVIFE